MSALCGYSPTDRDKNARWRAYNYERANERLRSYEWMGPSGSFAVLAVRRIPDAWQRLTFCPDARSRFLLYGTGGDEGCPLFIVAAEPTDSFVLIRGEGNSRSSGRGCACLESVGHGKFGIRIHGLYWNTLGFQRVGHDRWQAVRFPAISSDIFVACGVRSGKEFLHASDRAFVL